MKKSTKELEKKLSERIDEYCGIIQYRLLDESGKNGGRKWRAVLKEELEAFTLVVLFHFHQFYLPVNKTKTKTKT
jgi:hypothetical protein